MPLEPSHLNELFTLIDFLPYGGRLGIKSNAIGSGPATHRLAAQAGTMRFTKHAEARRRARGVKPAALELIRCPVIAREAWTERKSPRQQARAQSHPR